VCFERRDSARGGQCVKYSRRFVTGGSGAAVPVVSASWTAAVVGDSYVGQWKPAAGGRQVPDKTARPAPSGGRRSGEAGRRAAGEPESSTVGGRCLAAGRTPAGRHGGRGVFWATVTVSVRVSDVIGDVTRRRNVSISLLRTARRSRRRRRRRRRGRRDCQVLGAASQEQLCHQTRRDLRDLQL